MPSISKKFSIEVITELTDTALGYVVYETELFEPVRHFKAAAVNAFASAFLQNFVCLQNI